MKAFLVCCGAVLLTAAGTRAQVNPWLGTWALRLNSADEKPETLIYSDAGDGAMRMVSVEENSTLVTRFDGRPAVIDAEAAEPRTLAIKAVSPTRYSGTFSAAGTPRVRGNNTLAADRKTFIEVSWLIAKPEKTVTLIYERR